MKDDFDAEDRALSKLDEGLRALTTELESAAAEAERAAEAEHAAQSEGAAAPDPAAAEVTPAAAGGPGRRPENPYTEYRTRAAQAPLGAVPSPRTRF